MTASDPYALWDGAYVLGSLSAAERREFEAHLSGCPRCQRQVSELSGLPGWLSLTRGENAAVALSATPATVTGPAPLYAGLAAKVAVRRRKFVLAAAAAAIALAGTTAAITTALDTSTSPPPLAISSASSSVQLTFSGMLQRGMTATGTLASFPWGTQIDWHCSYAPASLYAGSPGGQDYVLVMVSTAGVETTVASWTAGPGSDVSPTATTGRPAHSIARLDIRDSTGTTLLSAVP
ncbi:hypothetical protein ART_0589 [Arthrobacter sp. PAMC 25486]|uniref:anti-sigma factor family protein n=1 Tax=Arthrobacter sp. PAMC 25486 TaxID=1494608 RepID=UPI0005361394|nr:zf-HC2 domain-containing protein [Arthrobacter sp. PAMC 25486]AIY00188.1 hypothetical protein ART_0589 [Arthrobacter sp. PAMC 25486]